MPGGARWLLMVTTPSKVSIPISNAGPSQVEEQVFCPHADAVTCYIDAFLTPNNSTQMSRIAGLGILFVNHRFNRYRLSISKRKSMESILLSWRRQLYLRLLHSSMTDSTSTTLYFFQNLRSLCTFLMQWTTLTLRIGGWSHSPNYSKVLFIDVRTRFFISIEQWILQ